MEPEGWGAVVARNRSDTMKNYAIVYLSTLVVLLPLEALFLGTIGKKMFDTHVGDLILESPRMAPAIIFYLIYLAGIVIFVNGSRPGDWASNLLYGALLGVLAYATYELTNMAVLRGWSWAVVAPDIAWGAFVTAVSATLGGLLASWVIQKVG
jgi:uncharacterized membrane protein